MHNYTFEEPILPLSHKDYVSSIDKKKIDFILLKFLLSGHTPKLSELPELYKRTGLVFFGYFYQKPVMQGGVFPREASTSSLCTSCDDAFIRIGKPYLDPGDVTLSPENETLNWLYFPPARFLKGW
jgi:hypothetical protein